MAAWNRISWGDLFTLANGVLGFIAITYILDDKFIAAAGLVFVSMMMDGLDGYIARRFGSKHSMGQVLDSISDSISFAFAPALLVYAQLSEPGGASLQNGAVLATSVAILATGLFRLARFTAGGYQLPYFVGMPAPAAALVVVLTCLLFGATGGAEPEKYYFALDEVPWLVLGTGLMASYLMASEIRYPKVHGWMAAAGAVALFLAILPYASGLLLVSDESLYTAFSRTATGVALALTLVYVFGGPFYEKLQREEGG
ncbi:MAG: CDP-diacylglycerol--serine O-phosphatidyltransferase [Euryarchaeota archaeon RBG_16_62_10]|nr:MAG: CDP-diacylglycerol--serine O-phosphatidyltransferase [Euryarchaeota archaeon RBG_16_62_10]